MPDSPSPHTASPSPSASPDLWEPCRVLTFTAHPDGRWVAAVESVDTATLYRAVPSDLCLDTAREQLEQPGARIFRRRTDGAISASQPTPGGPGGSTLPGRVPGGGSMGPPDVRAGSELRAEGSEGSVALDYNALAQRTYEGVFALVDKVAELGLPGLAFPIMAALVATLVQVLGEAPEEMRGELCEQVVAGIRSGAMGAAEDRTVTVVLGAIRGSRPRDES